MTRNLIDLRDIFLQKGEWDGSHYIIYIGGFDGVLDGEATDIIAAYYDSRFDTISLSVHNSTDSYQDWISPDTLDEDLYERIYHAIKSTK